MKNAYEGYLDRTGLACLGRVVSTEPKSRTIRVKTIGMASQGLDDLDLYNVRVLHGQWHLEGDEEVSMPRKNSYGVVIFIGPEPIWLGAIPLDMTTGQAQRANQVVINEGDKIIKTVAGNRIIFRTGGTIEIQSTEQCRTFWLPSENLINSVCQNFELETSGGYLKWKLNKEEETTNLNMKVWNSLNPDNGVELNVGTIIPPETDEPTTDIAAYAEADLVFDFKQGTLSTEDLSFTKRSLRMSIKKDGSIFLDIGPNKFTMTVNAETGDVTFETKGSVKGTVKKDVNLDVEGSVTAKIKKDLTMNVDGSMKATVKGSTDITSTGPAKITTKATADIDATGPVSIKSKATVDIDGIGPVTVKSAALVTLLGTGGMVAGGPGGPTAIDGAVVALGGGGPPVARIGDTAVGANAGGPLVATIITGSPKVTSG